MDPYELIIGIISLIYTQEALHSSFIWFYDASTKQFKTNHLEFGFCLDGFPVFSGSDGAAMISLSCFNLPGLIHLPEFSFLQSIFIDGECSKASWHFLRMKDLGGRIIAFLNTPILQS